MATDAGMAIIKKGKKATGASRGGSISKRERTAREMSGASIADAEEGKGYSTAAAKDATRKNV